jgi:hypothetical protein
MDLSDTLVEYLSICGMAFLEELILPRRCVLEDLSEVPCLRLVTFGDCDGAALLRLSRPPATAAIMWLPTEVRFEGMRACAEFSPGLREARVYGEVAAQMGRETLPFPPP